jgi:hypothetical protein
MKIEAETTPIPSCSLLFSSFRCERSALAFGNAKGERSSASLSRLTSNLMNHQNTPGSK